MKINTGVTRAANVPPAAKGPQTIGLCDLAMVHAPTAIRITSDATAQAA
ncbi:MAG: hypothetical protein FD149_2418 [Rhodospirillaceae bacterium]|nr:MAG: hypothetical protein FD149_2418 [Rhodospirillaceae bacterium]